MSTRAIILLVLAGAVLVAIGVRSPAGAKGRYVTDIAEKHKLIAERRPPQKSRKAACKLLDRVEPDKLAVTNALRFLARRDVRLQEDFRYPGRMPVPALGELEGHKDFMIDPWVALRLVALLRAGYPATPELLAEIGCWQQSSQPSEEASWSDVSSELLLVDALPRRKDAALKALQISSEKRGRQTVESRSWQFEVPDRPASDGLAELFHYLLSWRIARSHKLGNDLVPSSVETAILPLLRCVERLGDPAEPFWIEFKPTERNLHVRTLLLVGACLGLVESHEACADGFRTRCRKAAIVLKPRMPANTSDGARQPLDWRCTAPDSLAMLLACGEELRSLVPSGLVMHALGVNSQRFLPPRPRFIHFATALGWTLCPSRADQGTGREFLNASQRDEFAGQCLAILALCGGFDPGGSARANTPETEMLDVMDALDLEDLDDYFEQMVITDKAIDAAAAYLMADQTADGRFPGVFSLTKLGGHALVVHTLLEAGVDRADRRIVRAMAWMMEMHKEVGLGEGPLFAGTQFLNYSYSIVLKVFASYYRPEIIAASMHEARTASQYRVAAAKVQQAIPSAEHRDLISAISRRLSNNGGWGWSYGLAKPWDPPAAEPRKAEAPVTGRGNAEKERQERRACEGNFPDPIPPLTPGAGGDNSNSQYAMLGLKAALMLGAPVNYIALAWDAMRLVRTATVVDSTERVMDDSLLLTSRQKSERDADPRYAPDHPNRVKARAALKSVNVCGWDYAANRLKPAEVCFLAMTAGAVSSLAILRDALMFAPIFDAELVRQVEDCIEGGLLWLGRNYTFDKKFFEPLAKPGAAWTERDGSGLLYDMYSAERAAVLTGTFVFENVDWYRDGADFLIAQQAKDGSWPAIQPRIKPENCNACWAILFLKRSAPYLATSQPSPLPPSRGQPSPSGSPKDPVTGR